MAVVWKEPVTTWGSGDTYQYTDWNRVVGDTGLLLEYVNDTVYDADTFYNSHKVDADDFLLLSEWRLVRTMLVLVHRNLESSGYEIPTDECTADNINRMEMLLVLAQRKIANNKATLRTGEPYTGDFEVYTG